VIEPLPPDVRAQLLDCARQTLVAVAAGGAPPDVPRGGVFEEPAAVFVTLRYGESLRGCLGQTHATLPLGEAVRELTRDAATRDPRFPPVTPDEVAGIEIEISRLSAPEEATPDDIVVGRHGIIIRSGHHVGLLLPQVATEFGCDAAEFLGLGCRKAGLASSAWREEGVTISIFEAEVFGE
jgi:AmmeMemoRadiSam system protein A